MDFTQMMIIIFALFVNLHVLIVQVQLTACLALMEDIWMELLVHFVITNVWLVRHLLVLALFVKVKTEMLQINVYVVSDITTMDKMLTVFNVHINIHRVMRLTTVPVVKIEIRQQTVLAHKLENSMIIPMQ